MGCWDAYAYDDTYWYMFINIKENANTTVQVNADKAYMLKNASTRSYLVYDPVNNAVATIDKDANINEEEPGHSWQLIESEGETYIYNLGAKQYLVKAQQSAPDRMMVTAAVSNDEWQLTSDPTPICLTDGENGINMGGSDWLFVVNEQLSVDTGIEEVVISTSEMENDTRHDLQGRRMYEASKGFYIQNGKLRMAM